jgi:hypothetical protein
VGGDAVEEPAVVGDDGDAAGKFEQRIFHGFTRGHLSCADDAFGCRSTWSVFSHCRTRNTHQ